MNSRNSRSSYFETKVDLDATEAPPSSRTLHSPGPGSYPPVWRRRSQYHPRSDPGINAGRCSRKPAGSVRRRDHGECLVWRLETGSGCDLFRAHCQRLFFSRRRTLARRISQSNNTSDPVCFRRAVNLLVQCSAAFRAGGLAPLGNQLPFAGD